MLCRRCRRRTANRPRGLCYSCYKRPDARSRFPSICKFARRGVPDYNGRSQPAAVPTRALPGMPEKVAILAQRALLGQELWHPLDAPWSDVAAAI